MWQNWRQTKRGRQVIKQLTRLLHTNIDTGINITNINDKGLQGTANEYAKERRIYKDLIS